MVDPSRRGRQLSGEVRCAWGPPQRVLPGVHSERLLQRLLPLVRGRALHRPRPPLYWNMGISDSAVSLMLTE